MLSVRHSLLHQPGSQYQEHVNVISETMIIFQIKYKNLTNSVFILATIWFKNF